MSKTLVLLGASGSIGSQTLSILRKYPNDFTLIGFSVGKRIENIPIILNEFKSVKAVTVQSRNGIPLLQEAYPNIKFFAEDKGLIDLIDETDPEMVVNALVGFVGLYPTIYSLEHNKKVALANKEALVVGGEIVNNLLAQGKGQLFPIDSEHSAIWKCLKVDDKNVDKLIITASGGAFRKLTREELVDVKPEQALAHPTWNMGAKITIDCATMVNKSFEIIEAYYLFGYKYDRIKVLLHDESMIHSMVKYKDGNYRAEISTPDMRNPIEFALFEGFHEMTTYLCNNYNNFGDYHFHKFTLKRYPIVKMADVVISKQKTYGAVYNAANEVAVNAFLEGKIKFLSIEKIIKKMINEHIPSTEITYDVLYKTDRDVREKVRQLIEKGGY